MPSVPGFPVIVDYYFSIIGAAGLTWMSMLDSMEFLAVNPLTILGKLVILDLVALRGREC